VILTDPLGSVLRLAVAEQLVAEIDVAILTDPLGSVLRRP